jgi:iron complex outermembrane receptor protein
VSGAFDINGALESGLGDVELGASVFASRLSHAVAARERTDTTATGAERFDLVNAPIATRVAGFELLGRLSREPFRVTATLAHLRSTEWDPEGTSVDMRRRAALVPRTTAGVVASIEEEERFRIGVEFYYTGRQPLYENPYRQASRPYFVVGVLAERWVATPVGEARLFINLENIGNVRQTRYDPLLLPSRGMGGRWTTDAWTELSGFTVNGGIRLRMPGGE